MQQLLDVKIYRKIISTTILKALPFILLGIVMVLISLGIGLFALDFKSMAWPDVLTNNIRSLAYIGIAIGAGFGYAILIWQNSAKSALNGLWQSQLSRLLLPKVEQYLTVQINTSSQWLQAKDASMLRNLVFQFLRAFITTESQWGILGRRVAQFGLNRVSLDAIDLNSLTQDKIAPTITAQIDASLQERLVTSLGAIIGLFIVNIVLLVVVNIFL